MFRTFANALQRLFTPSNKSFTGESTADPRRDALNLDSQWKQHAHVKDIEIKELSARNEELKFLLKQKNAEIEDVRSRHRDFYLWQDYFSGGDSMSMDEILESFHIKTVDLSTVSSILYLINKNLDRIQREDLDPKSLDNPTQVTFASGAQSSLVQLKKDIAAVSAEANTHVPGTPDIGGSVPFDHTLVRGARG